MLLSDTPPFLELPPPILPLIISILNVIERNLKGTFRYERFSLKVTDIVKGLKYWGKEIHEEKK